MKVLWNKGEFYTQVYEKPFCTQEPRGFSHREVQGTVQLIQAVLNQWQDFSRMLRDVRIANRERVTVMRMQGGKRDVI